MNTEEKNWLRLHLTPGLGRMGIIRLREAFGSAEGALRAGGKGWIEKAGIRPGVVEGCPGASHPRFEAVLRDLEKEGVAIISLWDPCYPPLLAAIHDPPALLYVRGELPGQEALAVVGARRATPAGERLTGQICAELAGSGITIVSGLARGIDTAAHLGALEGSGKTVAVLGCGIDRVYPPENARLFTLIQKQGAILSEYPPGTPPLAGHFPGRNRIISGLSKGTLIVEAAPGSGSLITVDFALEQGREVFAVPGPVLAATGQGVNQVLKEGAHLVTEARDITEVLWPHSSLPNLRRQQETFAESLSESALKVYRELGNEPLHVDDLVRKCGLTPMEVSAILLHLELAGESRQLPGMRYVRHHKA